MSSNRVLALDYGTKRIGLALADLEFGIASPHGFIENKSEEFVSNELIKFIDEWGVSVVILGMPYNMKEEHKENPVNKRIKKFVTYFTSFLIDNDHTDVKLDFFDERLSTFEANLKIDQNKIFFKNRMDSKDAISAQIILERWLENN